MNEQKAKILAVEDDEGVGSLVDDFLKMSGYEVIWKQDGKSGLDAFLSNKNKIDLCILDVNLPEKDGFTLAKEIRAIKANMPIIFLTARTIKEDRIKGLRIGADDYITKPFSSEELMLRIEAILRRTQSGPDKYSSHEFQIGSYHFDPQNQTLNSPTETKHLTKKESEVLNLLCQYKNKLLRRELALKSIWGDDDYFMGRSMDVYITKLRKYLKEDTRIKIINVHGTGFKLEIKE